MAPTRSRANLSRTEETSRLADNHLSSHNGNLMNGKINGCTNVRSNGHLQIKKVKRRNDVYDPESKESFEEPTLVTSALTHLGFYILMFLGFINQLFFTPKVAQEQNRKGYVYLYDNFEEFYLRYVYRRIRDCWNRPICSVPGAMVTLKDRITRDYGWTFEFTGTETPCINLGSYNYLGFAEATGQCAEQSVDTLKKWGCACSSTRLELGSLPIHDELEKLTARFLNVEDAIVFGMGFATNALNLPSLLSPGCLVLSDEKNHASLILGLRLSGTATRVFQHNRLMRRLKLCKSSKTDHHVTRGMEGVFLGGHDFYSICVIRHLEKCLREAIVYGQNGSGEPWKKIFIVVEGIYSMEGSVVHLPQIIALKKKYKAYLYLDEAHSTGAMGNRGRGVCDYYGIDPRDVDILMGTFTKSFGSAGGYIAGSKALINHLRVQSHAHTYAASMSPPIVQQVITSMRIIMGEDGTDAGQKRTKQLARNTRYFRRRLHQLGVIIYGHEDSPVVPMLVYLFSKIGSVVRTLTTRNIATVGVGFPATPLMAGRIRFCLSAAHTKEQLDYVLSNVEEIADLIGLRYSRKPRDPNPIEYYSDSETE